MGMLCIVSAIKYVANKPIAYWGWYFIIRIIFARYIMPNFY